MPCATAGKPQSSHLYCLLVQNSEDGESEEDGGCSQEDSDVDGGGAPVAQPRPLKRTPLPAAAPSQRPPPPAAPRRLTAAADDVARGSGGTAKKGGCRFPGGCCGPNGRRALAFYGTPDSTVASRCAVHKEPGMVDVVSKHCEHPPGDCYTFPCFGHALGTPATRCSLHQEPGMVDMTYKQCGFPGCNLYPKYGPPGSSASTATRCHDHKSPGMIYHANPLCDHPEGCSGRSQYGMPGSWATCCRVHRSPGMVDVVVRRCNFPGGCNQWPEYGATLPVRCPRHREDGMLNLHRRYKPNLRGTAGHEEGEEEEEEEEEASDTVGQPCLDLNHSGCSCFLPACCC